MSSFEHIADFKQTMVAIGITPPDTINADGQIHRFGNKKNSWYVFHEGDISGGAFGDWKLGVNHTWCSKKESRYIQTARRESQFWCQDFWRQEKNVIRPRCSG